MKIRYDKSTIETLIAKSTSITDVVNQLKTLHGFGTLQSVSLFIKRHNIDISHFYLKRKINKNKISMEILKTKYLICPSKISSSKLKFYLLTLNLIENKCNICGMLPEWNGKTLVIQLHHLNHNNQDNRLENLQMICPNCHSQTENYAGRGISVRHKTCSCGKRISKKSTRCLKCNIEYLKQHPKEKLIIDKKELARLVWVYPMVKLSKILHVSDKAIKTRCVRENIITPKHGHWSKIKIDL